MIAAPAYNGVDGPLTLDPDGHVRRALAVFSVGRAGNALLQPAPQGVGGPVPALAPPAAPPGDAAPAAPAPPAGT